MELERKSSRCCFLISVCQIGIVSEEFLIKTFKSTCLLLVSVSALSDFLSRRHRKYFDILQMISYKLTIHFETKLLRICKKSVKSCWTLSATSQVLTRSGFLRFLEIALNYIFHNHFKKVVLGKKTNKMLNIHFQRRICRLQQLFHTDFISLSMYSSLCHSIHFVALLSPFQLATFFRPLRPRPLFFFCFL